jgi:hypothetical protein
MSKDKLRAEGYLFILRSCLLSIMSETFQLIFICAVDIFFSWCCGFFLRSGDDDENMKLRREEKISDSVTYETLSIQVSSNQ